MNTLRKRDFRHRSRINVNEPAELLYWSRAMNVSSMQLVNTVSRVGSVVDEIWAYLKG